MGMFSTDERYEDLVRRAYASTLSSKEGTVLFEQLMVVDKRINDLENENRNLRGTVATHLDTIAKMRKYIEQLKSKTD